MMLKGMSDFVIFVLLLVWFFRKFEIILLCYLYGMCVFIENIYVVFFDFIIIFIFKWFKERK